MKAGPLFDRDTADETRALVALALVPGVGAARLRALIARFGSARAILAAPARQLEAADGIGRQTAAAIASADAEALADEQLARAERVGAIPLALTDPAYPALLREITDPPTVLWVRGALQAEDERAVAIVGTRRATDYGKRVAHAFAGELARLGFTVVSGLAYGIDIAAHRGALDVGGRTIAVLGSGVDRIYPARHAREVEAIAAGQGAVVSELALGAGPDAPHFPRRNRIIAGLSLGTLVAEARRSGGALLTALLATEQNRAVFAVPAGVFGEAGEGTNQLIRRGYASLVTTVDELLEEIVPQLDAPPPAVAAAPAEPPPSLNETERRLFEALGETPIALDALCERTGLDTSTALVYLLELEFKGLVRQLAGRQFFKS